MLCRHTSFLDRSVETRDDFGNLDANKEVATNNIYASGKTIMTGYRQPALLAYNDETIDYFSKPATDSPIATIEGRGRDRLLQAMHSDSCGYDSFLLPDGVGQDGQHTTPPLLLGTVEPSSWKYKNNSKAGRKGSSTSVATTLSDIATGMRVEADEGHTKVDRMVSDDVDDLLASGSSWQNNTMNRKLPSPMSMLKRLSHASLASVKTGAAQPHTKSNAITSPDKSHGSGSMTALSRTSVIGDNFYDQMNSEEESEYYDLYAETRSSKAAEALYDNFANSADCKEDSPKQT